MFMTRFDGVLRGAKQGVQIGPNTMSILVGEENMILKYQLKHMRIRYEL